MFESDVVMTYIDRRARDGLDPWRSIPSRHRPADFLSSAVGSFSWGVASD
jgi:hypothetical protein